MAAKNNVSVLISFVILSVVASITRSQDMEPTPVTQPATTAPSTAVAGDQGIEITNKSGTLKLKLPAGWEESQPSNPQMEIMAETPSSEGVFVYSNPKADYVSLELFADSTHKNDLSALKNPKSTDAIKITVGGLPAIRYDSTYDDGVYKWGTVQIFTETATRYNDITVTGLRSAFDAHKDEWEKLASGLSEVAQ